MQYLEHEKLVFGMSAIKTENNLNPHSRPGPDFREGSLQGSGCKGAAAGKMVKSWGCTKSIAISDYLLL